MATASGRWSGHRSPLFVDPRDRPEPGVRVKLIGRFRFPRSAARCIGFGTTLTLCQLFWIVQSQSDIVIAGRQLHHRTNLGLYSEALFLDADFHRALPAAAERGGLPRLCRAEQHAANRWARRSFDARA